MIVITGAAGFIGSNIARKLIADGEKVLGVDDLSFGDLNNLPAGIDFLQDDFDKLPDSYFRNSYTDVLVHCATSNIIYAIDHPVRTFNNNALKTIELFRRFRGKIVYTSTSSVYGNATVFPTNEEAPVNVYNAYDTSKRIAELYLMQRGVYTTLRLSNVYGPFQLASNPYCGVIGKLVNCILEDKTFSIRGDYHDTRDYTFVEDVVEIIQKAVEMRPTYCEINVGTGEETSVAELIRLVGKLTNKHLLCVDAPPAPIDSIKRRCLDVKKAKQFLNWEPKTHIAAGLLETIVWNGQRIAEVQKKVS